MYNQMMITTRGDPLGTVRNLIRSIWQDANLEAMLIPSNGMPNSRNGSPLIRNPDLISQINPFNPMMLKNAARIIPGIMEEHPGMRIGVVFRPCEIRALNALTKRDGFELENLTTICVDCLGTYPSAEFHWRAERKGSPEALTEETLQFARQGGIMAYRYRSACQLCGEPDAREADVNIGVLGLPVRQYILVSTLDKTVSDRIHLDRWSPEQANMALLNQRTRLISRLTERRNRTHERVIQGIADVLPTDIESLIIHLAGCGTCQACLEACPICVIDFPQKDADNRYVFEDINSWLGSCAGCGMCEQACPQHHPLSAIFGYIHKEISGEIVPSKINLREGHQAIH